MLAWPGMLNMLSIIVQGMGLQYISASVSQMIQGDKNNFALCGHVTCMSCRAETDIAADI